VVDDSAVIRHLVTDILRADPAIEVVGTAPDGRVAVAKVAQLEPDVVTMDVEMPQLNGIEAVREIRRTHPRLPIVMFSTVTERGAAATIDALAAGASDYVTKPGNVASLDEARTHVQQQLVAKVKVLAQRRRVVQSGAVRSGDVQSGAVQPGAVRPGAVRPGAASVPPARRRPGGTGRPLGFGVLAIGCSTGGPDALATVLAELPADLAVPVVIVQHMPALFTRMLAERLDKSCHLTVSEAVDGDQVAAGRVLIAPGGRHLTIEKTRGGNVVRLTDDPPENYCRPAVDVLFRSVAGVYGERALALVLTGMGRDGAAGARAIRDLGGEIVAQDESTSVVWGMPGAVVQAGLADHVAPLPQVGADVLGLLTRHARGSRSASGVGRDG
jgi:two-component system chemotaxis response regulator CheB